MRRSRDRRFTLDGGPWPSGAVGLAAGLLFAAWRFPVLWQLPVWDGAKGVSPAAITLERLDFDVAALLQMGAYGEGGPAVHAFSAYTWFMALMVRVCGSYLAALPWLHAASFAILGVLAAGTHRLAKVAGASPTGAVLAAALAVLFPPMVVQASDVYLDLPLAAATVWVFAFALEDRWPPALVAASIAAAVKPSAVIVLPVLAWLVIDRRPIRWGRLGALAGPAVIAFAPLVLDPGIGVAAVGTGNTVRSAIVLTLLDLSMMPILILLILAVAVLHLVGGDRDRDPVSRRLATAALLLVLSYLLFFFFNPILSKGVRALPRYTTMFAPVLAAALVTTGESRFPGRRRSIPGVVFLLLFLANMHGRVEPPSMNWYSLAERSLAYEKMVGVQRAALARFEELGQRMPAYYDHFTHYRLTYPATGWSSGPVPDGTPVRITPERPWRDLAQMPGEFVLLLEGEWLGGEELAGIKRRALASDAWSVESQLFQDGEFTNEVIVVRRIEADGGSSTHEAGQNSLDSPGRDPP